MLRLRLAGPIGPDSDPIQVLILAIFPDFTPLLTLPLPVQRSYYLLLIATMNIIFFLLRSSASWCAV